MLCLVISTTILANIAFKEQIAAMAKVPALLFFSFFISFNSFSQNLISHSIWDGLLKEYVSQNGNVNYKGLKKSEAKLDEYLSKLSTNAPKNNWSKTEKLAYWINAYNAFTIKRILKAYPLNSITKLDNGKTWDVKWIKIENNTYSLNDIENTILRTEFKEPRIHFAINCAAKSCPPLYNRAWTAANMESDLELRTRSFIQNPVYNSVEANKAGLSKLFDWYKTDFGDLISFINKYSKLKLTTKATISYKEYNWSLNE